jgi:hypothetical protein
MPSLLRTDLESQDKTGPVSTVLFIHIVLDDMNNFSGGFGNNIATWDVKMFRFAWFGTILGSLRHWHAFVSSILGRCSFCCLCSVLSKLSSSAVLQHYLASQHMIHG